MKSSIIVVSSEAPPEEGDKLPQGKVIKKAGKRVGYNYIIIKSFKESPKNDVVKCWYIKSLTDFGVCVIKEGSYGDTKDKSGRDIIDRLKWQTQLHLQLQDKVRIPRLLGHFEERGNYYLVIEHIRGKSLQTFLSERRRASRRRSSNQSATDIPLVKILTDMAILMETLHAEGIVHRDASPNNFMILPNGKVALIDMELSYSIPTAFPTPAFALGTHGYMSAQQEAQQVPTTAEDVFALGAIMLQTWSNVAPSKLVKAPHDELCTKIRFFVPDRQISSLIEQCLHPEVDKRPNSGYIRQQLQKLREDTVSGVSRPVNRCHTFATQDMLNTVQGAINTLSTPLLADGEKGWFAEDMKEPDPRDTSKFQKAWYASFSKGVAGILYTLAQARLTGITIEGARNNVEKALDLIQARYIDRIAKTYPGLHNGGDGVAVALVAAMKAGSLDTSIVNPQWINLLLEKTAKSRTFNSGVCGQGIANMLCKEMLPDHTYNLRMQTYEELLISQQEQDGSWTSGYHNRRFRPRQRRITKGFAEGMAGFICFLLEYGAAEGRQNCMEAATRGLYWLARQSKSKQGAIRWTTSLGQEMSYSLTNGAAGVALAFVRGYEHTGNPMFRHYASATLKGIDPNILDNCLSHANGLSGLGEAYLEAYRVLGDAEWLERADWIAQVIMHMTMSNHKHGEYWLVESERQPVGGFMVGMSGVIHFLLRRCNPELVQFPLLPHRRTTK